MHKSPKMLLIQQLERHQHHSFTSKGTESL